MSEQKPQPSQQPEQGNVLTQQLLNVRAIDPFPTCSPTHRAVMFTKAANTPSNAQQAESNK